MDKTPRLYLVPHKPDLVVHISLLSKWKQKGQKFSVNSWQWSKFEASVGYMRHYFKTTKNRARFGSTYTKTTKKPTKKILFMSSSLDPFFWGRTPYSAVMESLFLSVQFCLVDLFCTWPKGVFILLTSRKLTQHHTPPGLPGAAHSAPHTTWPSRRCTLCLFWDPFTMAPQLA